VRRTLIGLVAGIAIGIMLVSMTGIGNAAEGDVDTDASNPLTAWIPDLKVILNDALKDIFDSGSAEISDPVIAEFYGKLTSNLVSTVSESGMADAISVAGYSSPEIVFPLVRMAAPVQASLVSGLVLFQIDAIDDKDPIGTLVVSILIDGTSSISAVYSPASGYYEAVWDSSSVPVGTLHTISANVIDSEGDATSIVSVVSVE
jgi:hypothetical protein